MRSTLHRIALLLPLLFVGCDDPTPRLHIERTVVASGEDIVVVFDSPLSGRATNQYWIALQRADEPLSSTAGRVVLERTDRSVRLHADQAGDFEVRLHGGYPRRDHHLLARIPIAAGTWPMSVGAQPSGTAYPSGAPTARDERGGSP